MLFRHHNQPVSTPMAWRHFHGKSCSKRRWVSGDAKGCGCQWSPIHMRHHNGSFLATPKIVRDVWSQAKTVCQEKKVSRREMPKNKDAKRKRRQRKAAEKTSVSRNSDDIRRTLSGEKSVSSLGLQSCQQEGLSRFRIVRSKPDQEKVAASDKDGKRKKCQSRKGFKSWRSQRPCQSGGRPSFL